MRLEMILQIKHWDLNDTKLNAELSHRIVDAGASVRDRIRKCLRKEFTVKIENTKYKFQYQNDIRMISEIIKVYALFLSVLFLLT